MAITTTYKGIEYRSRLEARWAAFFDNIGWQHTYEPFDGDGYIPDFLIHGDNPLLVEVKPAATRAEYEGPIPKITAGLWAHWQHDILIVGATPLPWNRQSEYFEPWHPPAGLLGERWEEETDWAWAKAGWLRCSSNGCGAFGVFHEEQSYGGRPCGHAEGDHFMGAASIYELQQAWAEACNDVKWRGKPAA